MKDRLRLPTVEYVNFRRAYPNMGRNAFRRWFWTDRKWSGKLRYVGIRHHVLIFDFRGDHGFADLTRQLLREREEEV